MKEILEMFGFVYQGGCRTCGGNADIYKKGNITCKIFTKKMRFTLVINNNQIIGKSAELEQTLNTYCPI